MAKYFTPKIFPDAPAGGYIGPQITAKQTLRTATGEVPC